MVQGLREHTALPKEWTTSNDSLPPATPAPEKSHDVYTHAHTLSQTHAYMHN